MSGARSVMFALALGAASTATAVAQQPGGGPPAGGWFGGEIEVSCDVVGVEGVQILTVHGVARNDRDALIEAQRNAIRVILFRGVQTSVCTVPPLFRPADITPEHDRFFSRMMAPNGPYLGYLSFTGDQVESRIRVGRMTKVGTTISVNVTRLRQDLEAASLLRALGSEFRRP